MGTVMEALHRRTEHWWTRKASPWNLHTSWKAQKMCLHYLDWYYIHGETVAHGFDEPNAFKVKGQNHEKAQGGWHCG